MRKSDEEKATIKPIKVTALPLLALAVAAVAASPGTALAELSVQAGRPTVVAAKPTIVLVHGAFMDGTSWQRLILLLEKGGYTVVAVQNALASLADDVAATRRVIKAQTGPVVAVGHSYGGAVITGAAAGEPNVRALVYISAFAPDAGESVGAFIDKYPTPLASALAPDAAGFLYVDRAKFHRVFCADVAAGEARVMAAVQKPLAVSIFGESVPSVAWRTIPSWYVVAQDDLALSPDLERFYARRMGAQITEIRSSHVPFISHPQEIARLIAEASDAQVH